MTVPAFDRAAWLEQRRAVLASLDETTQRELRRLAAVVKAAADDDDPTTYPSRLGRMCSIAEQVLVGFGIDVHAPAEPGPRAGSAGLPPSEPPAALGGADQ